MNSIKPITLVRYGAHLVALILGAIVTALMIKGATFSALTSQAFGVSLVVLAGGWIVTVLTILANTGTLPEQPPTVERPEPPPPPPTATA